MKATSIKNHKGLTAELDKVQSRSRVRTISVEDILEALNSIEEMLGISKKALRGVSVWVDVNAQRFPGAYKGTPESTQFKATYRSGWTIVQIGRYPVCAPSNAVSVTHTEESRRAIIARMSEFSL